MMNLEGH